MSAPDDELVRRYREASELEHARPGAQVRDAVRAHAQMLAAAAGTNPVATAPGSRFSHGDRAANQSRWRLSALATVALVGLTGLLVLQFERGTPEERETAFGQRRAEAPRPAPSPAPETPAARVGSAEPAAETPTGEPAPRATVPDRSLAPSSPSARSTAQKPTAPAADQAHELAKTAPAPSPSPAAPMADSAQSPGATGSLSGFPASPPVSADPSVAARPPTPPAQPSPSAARAEMRERSIVQDDAASSALQRPPQASAPAARNLPSRKLAAAPNANAGPSPSGSPDLWEAARSGNTAQVERLIDQGAPVNAPDKMGKTALMLAAMNGQTATAQKLLALGANAALTDHEGLTAAQQARRLGHTGLADLIDAPR